MAVSLGAAEFALTVDQSAFNAGLKAAEGTARGAVGGISGALSGLGNAFLAPARGIGAFSDSLGRIAGLSVGINAVSAAFNGLGGLIGSAQDSVLGFNSQLQKASITFTAFAGSVQLSEQFISQLKDLAATSPFEFQDVLKGAQRFAGMGLAMENIIPIMKDISVVAQAMGAGAAQINEINLAISQVVARGKVSAQEMNQLANAGIPAWQLLADAMGMTIGEVQKLAEAGKVSAADFLNAFDKAAHDPKLLALGEAMNKSFDTAISNVHDRLQFFAADAGKPIFELATNVANGLANILGTPVIQGMANGISRLVAGMVDALAPLGDAFNAAFAKLQAGDLQGALSGILSSINGFATQMFGAGYTLITTMANGMLSGLSAVATAAAEIAANIAAFFIGNSPPKEGPLSQIDQGGANIMAAYVDGMKGGLGDLQGIAQGVTDSFNSINVAGSLSGAQAALQAAAGNAALLKTEAANAGDVLRTLDSQLHDLDQSSQGLKFAAEDIKSAYEDQIGPLEAAAKAITDQNDLLDKQLSIADQIKDAELKRAEILASGDPVKRAGLQSQIDANNERLKDLRLAQQQVDLEKQIAEAKKAGGDPAALQVKLQELQLQKQTADLEKQKNDLVDKTGLAQIKQQQALQKEEEDRRQIDQNIIKLQREQAAAPLLALAQKLKAEEAARLKPLEDQAKVLDRQRALLQAQKQEWTEIKQAAAAAAAAMKPVAGGAAGATAGGGLAGLHITPQPIAPLNEAAAKLATQFGESFQKSVNAWFAAHGGELQGALAGAFIGGTIFGPIGAVAGGIFGAEFVKSLQEKFPDVGKIVQEKLSIASFAIEAFGKILGGQDAYIIPFQEALKKIVPPEFQGLITNAGTTVALLRDAFLTVVQVLKGEWSPGITEASSGIDPFVRNVGIAALAIKDALGAALNWIATVGWPAFTKAATNASTWWTSTGQPAFSALVDFFKTTLPPVLTWISETAWPALVTAGTALAAKIGEINGFFVELFAQLDKRGVFTELEAAWKTLGDIANILGKMIGEQVNPNLTEMDGKAITSTATIGRLADNISLAAKNFNEGVTALKSFAEWCTTTGQKVDDLVKALSGLAGGNVLEGLAALERLLGWKIGGGGGGRDTGGGIRTSFNPGTSSLSSIGDNGSIEAYIRARAQAEGIDPDIAVRVAMHEGGVTSPNAPGDSGSSFGPFQLHSGGLAGGGNAVGGLGDAFTAATGLNAADPAAWQAGVDFALHQAAQSGWGAWHGAAAAGIGDWQGIGGQQMAFTPPGPQQMPSPQVDQAVTAAIKGRTAAQIALNVATTAAGPANATATTTTTALGAVQQQGTTWAQEMARQQQVLTDTLTQQAPPGRAATDAMTDFGSVLGPIERQVASGSISLNTLQFKLLDVARATGLNSDAFAKLDADGGNIDQVFTELIRTSASLGPQFQSVADYLDTAGSSSREAALRFLQLALNYQQGGSQIQTTSGVITAATASTITAAQALAAVTPAIGTTETAIAAAGSETVGTAGDVAGMTAKFTALRPTIDAARGALGGYVDVLGQMTTDSLDKQASGWDKIRQAIDDALKALKDYLDALSSAPSGATPPGFATGGIVPGIGPQLTILHGGEMVSTVANTRRMLSQPSLLSGYSGGSTAAGAYDAGHTQDWSGAEDGRPLITQVVLNSKVIAEAIDPDLRAIRSKDLTLRRR